MKLKTIRLVEEVEKIYRRPIKEELVATWDTERGGESEVSANGEPIIRINIKRQDREEILAHELWHLKLTAQGYPKKDWGLVSNFPDIINPAQINDFDELVLDSIIHSKFYPQLKRDGYDPVSQDRQYIQQLLKTLPAKGQVYTRKAIIMNAVHYIKSSLEFGKDPIIKQLALWYKKNGLSEQLQLAESALAALNQLPIDTPHQVLEGYVRCLNILTKDLAEFRIEGWEQERLGENFTRQIVKLRGSPPSLSR